MIDNESEELNELIGDELSHAQQISGNSVEERLKHLHKAQELLLYRDGSGSLLDNFLDEMLEFALENDVKIRCFVATFIDKACRKDCDIMKKAVVTLSYLLEANADRGVSVVKKVIQVCCQLYSLILKWACNSRSVDVERCWEAFSVIKGRIMRNIDSDNEGIRTQTIKFLEAVVLAQSLKTEESEKGRGDNNLMCLNEISRQHRFISYRKMESEAQLNFNSLLEQLASPHISSLNLLTCLSCVCSVAQQRPQFMPRVIAALESLHVNLPPTLAMNQVKSVRKELKMHLLRFLRHPTSVPHHQRLTTLLTELGAGQSEIMRALPATSELRRKASQRHIDSSEEPDKKRQKKDDGGDIGAGVDDSKSQVAINITAQFVYERLTPSVATDLVMVSLMALPDEIPAAFQDNYIPVSAAGTESQIRNLSVLIATQMTSMELGPGIEKVRAERQQLLSARKANKTDGASVLSAAHDTVSSSAANDKSQGSQSAALLSKAKPKIQFGLLSITREFESPDDLNLTFLTFRRILANEKRSIQGGFGVAQQKLLVRLVTRFQYESVTGLEDLMIEHIIQDQKARTELALLWIAELYSQLRGFTVCRTSYTDDGQLSEDQRYERYDSVLCKILESLHKQGGHKETLFHKILLEAPLLTPHALDWLRTACLDEGFSAFGMTTLRELILTRTRQRFELLSLLLDFSYSSRNDVRFESVEIAKELYQISYVRKDVRDYLVNSLEHFNEPVPPLHICANLAEEAAPQWNDLTIRTSLNLFLSILPLDHPLIHNLAKTYATASNDIKRVILRAIDSAVKTIGATSNELLDMIEKCPPGAETLAARIVHLLTERSAVNYFVFLCCFLKVLRIRASGFRNPPTHELVERIIALYNQGRTDVRSMIPVLSGLEKDQILKILPNFILNAVNQKSIPSVFHKLLAGKNIKTGQHPMGASELLVAVHRIKATNTEETNLLLQNIELLLNQLSHSKEAIASAIDTLIDDTELPVTVFHTVARTHESYPVLGGFISNVIIKIVQKQPWKYDGSLWQHFVRCAIATIPHSYMALLTGLSKEEFMDFIKEAGEDRTMIIKRLRDYIPTMSVHQQKKIDRGVRDVILGN
ncbi:unnamed protein product [Enterobius vermicularis]|uniref:Symplekin n=1 Tax=Enterobius vermicularis TaxID=51028 RepID=A0A0N4UVS7_ENTVE|nr:unnamed protein product [Enterobius vermicularis]